MGKTLGKSKPNKAPGSKTINYPKRRRGAFKKAMELAKKCNCQVMMCVYDRKKNYMTTFYSDESTFDSHRIEELRRQKQGFEFEEYRNSDYQEVKEHEYLKKRKN